MTARTVGWYLWMLVGIVVLGSGAAVGAPRPAAVPGEGRSQSVAAGEVPQGLSAVEWASIQGQIEAGRYRAYADERGGYRSANPAQGWQIAYGADGHVQLTPREPGATPWEASLRLVGYGVGTMHEVSSPQSLQAAGERLSYQWDGALEEWWVNRPTGLEQGFTLRERPAGAQVGEPLRVALSVGGTLVPVQQGDSLAWQDTQGAVTLSYSKLRVWDAAGRLLPARMALAGQRLTLLVEEEGARYPLTIDPLLQQAYLKASNTEANDGFGYAVAVSGDTVVVGAFWESSNATGVDGDQTNNDASWAGAAYVFVRSGTGWAQQAYLKASNTDAFDHFGESVAVSGETVVVGASHEASSATGVNGDQANNSAYDSGAAYVFTRSGTSWAQQAYLKASNTGVDDQFGSSVAVSGDTVVVGAYREASNATGVNGDQANNDSYNAGAAYVFTRSGTSWAQQAYLKASNTGWFDEFGNAVAISGDTVVVGAHREDSNATGVNGDQANNDSYNAGAAYVFTRSGTSWAQQAYLKASNTDSQDFFGYSVAVSGDTVVVGAPDEDSSATGVNGNQANNDAYWAGAAYLFTRSGTSWAQQAYLKASNTDERDSFGESVAVSGDTVVVGARYEASNATGVNGDQANNDAFNSGAAYVFTPSGTSWAQQAYLKASNTETRDGFGWSVAVSGDTVVVGAFGEASNATGVNGDQANNDAPYAGAAYLFTMSAPTAVTLGALTAAPSGRAARPLAALGLTMLALGWARRRGRA